MGKDMERMMNVLQAHPQAFSFLIGIIIVLMFGH